MIFPPAADCFDLRRIELDHALVLFLGIADPPSDKPAFNEQLPGAEAIGKANQRLLASRGAIVPAAQPRVAPGQLIPIPHDPGVKLAGPIPQLGGRGPLASAGQHRSSGRKRGFASRLVLENFLELPQGRRRGLDRAPG